MKSKSVEIHGTKYIINLHPGEEATDVGTYISSLVQPIALEMQTVMSESDIERPLAEMEEHKKTAIKNAFNTLLKALPSKEFLALAKECFKYTRTEDSVDMLGNKSAYDTHFQGNQKSVIPLMKAVIDANGFLDLNVLELVT